jgi:hypothetical protein
VERYHGCEQCWRKTLAQVDDDLESRYLAAKRDQLDFVLSVPNHGELHAGVAMIRRLVVAVYGRAGHTHGLVLQSLGRLHCCYGLNG